VSREYRDGSSVPVVVAGAGPVGVSAAILLAQRGIETLVVDRWDDIYPLPRAVHLDDEIYRVLQDMGVADQFAEITMPTLGLRLIDAQHHTMAEFRRSEPVGEHGYPPANMFDQPDLERVLRDRLSHLPQSSLVCGTELVHVDRDPDAASGQLRVRLRELASGREYTVQTRAVLGCDGANSTVRELVGATMEDLGFEERWIVADVRCETALPIWQGVHQLCDPRRAGTLMQVGPGRYRWEFQLLHGETSDELLASGALKGFVQPWLGDVRFEDLELLKHAEYTFRARLADRWRDGRIFLLGDAAHLTPPFIGQGLCAGLRDAANLSWKLAAVLNGTSEELLDSYETERKPHARALVRKAVTVGWAMTGGQDWAAHVRRVALAVAVRIPGTTDKVLDAKPPRFSHGVAVRPQGRGDKVTGAQVPQPFVDRAGQRIRLDEATGPGHSVLVVGEPDPRLIEAAAQAGATVVRVVAAGAPVIGHSPYTVVVDDEGHLLQWFKRGRTAAVLVRPDHVVQAREARHGRPAPGGELAVYLSSWTREVSWSGHAPAAVEGRR
jgi:3-(3-hydroxy-phenyl)propionate hydroxylase